MAGTPPTQDDYASGPELMDDPQPSRPAEERVPDPYGPPPPPPIPRVAARQAPRRSSGGAVTAIVWSLIAVLVIGGAAAAYFLVIKRSRYEGEWTLASLKVGGTEIDLASQLAKAQGAGTGETPKPKLILKPDGAGEITGGIAGGGGSVGAASSQPVKWSKTEDGIKVALPTGLGAMGAAMGVPETVDAVGKLEDGKLNLSVTVLSFETVMVFERE